MERTNEGRKRGFFYTYCIYLIKDNLTYQPEETY